MNTYTITYLEPIYYGGQLVDWRQVPTTTNINVASEGYARWFWKAYMSKMRLRKNKII